MSSVILLRPGSRLRVSQSGLLKRLLQFNYALAGDVHDSRLDVLGGPREFVSRIQRQPRGAIQLTQRLNAATGFTPLMPGDFADTDLQVALLPGRALVRVIQMCAATLLCDAICSELGRQRRIELEQALPPDVLLFARHRCRLTVAPLASRTLTILRPNLADKSTSWPFRIEETCRKVCGSLWEAYPSPVLERLALKLPRAWQPTNRPTAGRGV